MFKNLLIEQMFAKRTLLFLEKLLLIHRLLPSSGDAGRQCERAEPSAHLAEPRRAAGPHAPPRPASQLLEGRLVFVISVTLGRIAPPPPRGVCEMPVE